MYEILEPILYVLGGGVVAAGAMFKWLGNISAQRIAESQKHANQMEVEKLKSQLELRNEQLRKVQDGRFALYNEVWKHLNELVLRGDRLWHHVSRENLHDFHIALHNATVVVNEGTLLLTHDQKDRLENALREFSAFHLGKTSIMELKNNSVMRDAIFSEFTERELSNIAQHNKHIMDNYKQLAKEIEDDFRTKIQNP